MVENQKGKKETEYINILTRPNIEIPSPQHLVIGWALGLILGI